MSTDTTHDHRTRRLGRLRANGAAGLVLVLTTACILVAVIRPTWATEDLRQAIESAGTVAPVVFTVLCALAAPIHLSKLFVLIAPLIWTQPTAVALSLVGCATGCVATAVMLARAGADNIRRHTDLGPRWLGTLTGQRDRRPLLVGILLRFFLGTGAAIEALLVAGRYGVLRYSVVTVSGLLLWIGFAQGGTALVASLVDRSPWFILLVASPPLLLVTITVVRAARIRRQTP
ncbi:MAG: hypothetical protein ACRCY8_10450 [Dermatophilaceae bacterium]